MIKKKIWIINHYATNMFYNKGGRHYWFAKYLEQEGYRPVIFSCNVKHGSLGRFVETDDLWIEQQAEDINVPFVLVNSSLYKGNGIDRIKNMFGFYRNVKKVAKAYAKKHDVPDVIYASSVHPLSLVAGIQLAKYFGIKCICEIRDLWPESIVAYSNKLTKSNAIVKLLYKGEKWIYKKADALIMTWSGGKKYIIDQGWQDKIDLSKITHISNGVVVKEFDDNNEYYLIEDSDLKDESSFKITYTGSIRKVNNLGMILDTAKLIQEDEKYKNKIKFLIFGNGDELDMLLERCSAENITNVVFKGRVEKKFIPSILKKSDVTLLHNASTSLDKYGQSQNKLFEYLAAGNCVLQTYITDYSVLEKYDCGISVEIQKPAEIAKAILYLYENEEKRKYYGTNARVAAFDFDFVKLTDELISVIETL